MGSRWSDESDRISALQALGGLPVVAQAIVCRLPAPRSFWSRRQVRAPTLAHFAFRVYGHSYWLLEEDTGGIDSGPDAGCRFVAGVCSKLFASTSATMASPAEL